MQRLEFGLKVRDQLTGFEGLVTGYAKYITGCDQFLVTPGVDEKGGMREGRWFDDQRLEVLEAPAVVLKDPRAVVDRGRNGADTPAPVK
jgi:hypothetical protein